DGSPSEIGTLSEALRRLVAQTQLQQQRLREHLADLESTVEARTRELSDQRREFRDFLDHAPALILSVDEKGALLYTNHYWDREIGRGANEPETVSIDEFLPDDAEALWWEAADKVLSSGDSIPLRLRIMSAKSGELEVSGRLIWQMTAEGDVSIRGVFQDITELLDVQRQLRHSQELLSLFVKNAPAGIAMFDRDMTYLSVSERWLKDHQLEGQEIIGRSYYEVFPRTAARWRRVHRQCLQSGISMKKEEDTLERSDGTLDWIRWEVIPWRNVEGGVGGLIMLTEVITDQKLLQDQLKVLADYDALTGLLNRRAFLAQLRRLANRRDRHQPSYGLLFLDLNRFKQINDRYGHGVGDKVLQEVGIRLKAESRAGDTPGRLAGDEFVVLLSEARQEQLQGIIDRYARMFDDPIEIAGRQFRVTASIGGVIANEDEPVDSVLERADKEMYGQKNEQPLNEDGPAVQQSGP
ncbi:MAG: diguanylate cyclase, partial [Xanthomonadales bacterium]|nr:diguanylate cyclase [Xanthomonadales bacterium]